MAVLGICHTVAMRPDTVNAGMAIADFKCCGLVVGNLIGPVNMSLDNIDPSSGAAAIEALIGAQGQTYLTTSGYTFGSGDSVLVFGVA